MALYRAAGWLHLLTGFLNGTPCHGYVNPPVVLTTSVLCLKPCDSPSGTLQITPNTYTGLLAQTEDRGSALSNFLSRHIPLMQETAAPRASDTQAPSTCLCWCCDFCHICSPGVRLTDPYGFLFSFPTKVGSLPTQLTL